MEGGESILDVIFEDDNIDVQDVDMLDVEEGELVEQNSFPQTGQDSSGNISEGHHQESHSKTRKRRNNKKKNKRKKGSSGPNTTDVNRFVMDVCKRLRERKSYLVWTAVGCLGVSALSDLVKEMSLAEANKLLPFLHLVDAIMACGGQKTSDGKRFRTGGGILWSILKTREPNAYKEIMKKGREFEKQFRQAAVPSKDPSKTVPRTPTDQTIAGASDNLQQLESPVQNQVVEQALVKEKRVSVHDRLRVPVSYDDDLLGEEEVQKDEST